MLKFALVGNIACGKSAVEEILKSKGIKVADSDKICHSLLTESEAVKTVFRDYDVFEDGEISREKLGKLVFGVPKLKTTLENILYPELREKINEFFAKNTSEKVAFVAIPLLFEAGMEDLFDKVLFIDCPDDIRKIRLIKRNGYSPEYAQIRMDAQMSAEKKIARSDYVIKNDSTLENLCVEVESFLKNNL